MHQAQPHEVLNHQNLNHRMFMVHLHQSYPEDPEAWTLQELVQIYIILHSPSLPQTLHLSLDVESISHKEEA